MPDAPAVSVIMTVHNRERFVEAAVRSVLTQSLRDLELILWDDQSTDSSREICRGLAAGDPRIRLVEGEHQGLVRSLAAAHGLARGGYIGWVDSDDLLVKTALEECVRELERRPEADMVYTQHLVIDEHDRAHGLGSRCSIPYSRDRLLTDFMTHHFRLLRRGLYEKVGGIDTTLEAAPDYDFCLKASEVGTIVHLAKPLYCYRVHPYAVSAERRLVQIRASAAAVEKALVRRGLAGRLRLHVEIESKFILVAESSREQARGGSG